jgi:hypothetical protein
MNDDTVIECQWTIDSETGDRVLVETRTGKEVMRTDGHGRLLNGKSV